MQRGGMGGGAGGDPFGGFGFGGGFTVSVIGLSSLLTIENVRYRTIRHGLDGRAWHVDVSHEWAAEVPFVLHSELSSSQPTQCFCSGATWRVAAKDMLSA